MDYITDDASDYNYIMHIFEHDMSLIIIIAKWLIISAGAFSLEDTM